VYLISTSKKIGLKSPTSEHVKIYDSPEFTDRNLVYNYKPKGAFNLPKGKFYTQNKLIQVKPVNWFIPLPKFERNEKPKNVKVIAGKHPHKCIIYRGRNLIIYDKDYFKTLKKIERLFVLAHEIGHYKYMTELYCDIYAANKLLQYGYNPSQIARCPFYALSGRNNKRKLELLHDLTQVKKV